MSETQNFEYNGERIELDLCADFFYILDKNINDYMIYTSFYTSRGDMWCTDIMCENTKEYFAFFKYSTKHEALYGHEKAVRLCRTGVFDPKD